MLLGLRHEANSSLDLRKENLLNSHIDKLLRDINFTYQNLLHSTLIPSSNSTLIQFDTKSYSHCTS